MPTLAPHTAKDIVKDHLTPLACTEVCLRFSLNYLVLAPSSHNLQRWRFIVDGDTLILSAGRTRAASVTDAFERELVIGRGSPQGKLSNVCCLTGVGLGLTTSYLKPVETEQLRDSLRQNAEMTAQLPLPLRMGRGSHAGHWPRRPIQEYVS